MSIDVRSANLSLRLSWSSAMIICRFFALIVESRQSVYSPWCR